MTMGLRGARRARIGEKGSRRHADGAGLRDVERPMAVGEEGKICCKSAGECGAMTKTGPTGSVQRGPTIKCKTGAAGKVEKEDGV